MILQVTLGYTSLISQITPVPTLHYIELVNVRPEGDLWPQQQPETDQRSAASDGQNYIVITSSLHNLWMVKALVKGLPH